MLGRTACTGTARGGRVDSQEGLRVDVRLERVQGTTPDKGFLTDWLFLGGENLLVGLPSTVSGALRLVLRLDLQSSSDQQLTH